MSLRYALALLAVLAAGPAFPQEPDAKPRAQELDSAREQLERARITQEALKREIETLRGERGKLSAELIDTAQTIRETERRLTESEDRLGSMTASEKDVRENLASRRDVLATLLGALQRMGLQPPPALLVEPADALTAVRSSMLLGSVLPELRIEAEALSSDLAELTRVRREIEAERTGLADEKKRLDDARVRLSALVATRQAMLSDRERELTVEEKRTAELAREVSDLESLIARMEAEVAPAKQAAEAAAAAESPTEPPPPSTQLAALGDPGRLAPAVAFASAKGLLPLPATGTQVKGFGVPDGFGGTTKGQTRATRAGAQVTAPCDGWVVYAGPFRSYGQLLILNAGGGYHVLLAGMENITVELGQFVLTGEPVAQMGQGGTQVASTEPLAAGKPVLYIEFRKDGSSIDPAPWWAAASNEKVRS
ncbi:membrane protein [Agaricicola taiwanensis]|uniref:Membrane protein n=1 Tax=Agaricicola taiwanensis TaxID=591372 RepID=A0A8J2VJC9_9RHOB|nr:peptidoglycan DD-metalloendopeptidase family protein [Agaricicola taiwanensis]GGE26963.1 membrane protein [Agaricicola taiwanensis]